jgi:hypothetical protein
MRAISIDLLTLHIDPTLTRTRQTTKFEEHLRASIKAIGLVEPIKVAPMPGKRYVVIDGVMRVRAFRHLSEGDPRRFGAILAYVYDYESRFQVRYQSDIYQDLLPSQLAQLVEHLHNVERVTKANIASYIGVSPATLRNYTGLWRLLERGGLHARVVRLMDLNVLPSSNPYAWLRLTPAGVQVALSRLKANKQELDQWIDEIELVANTASSTRYTLKDVEHATSDLPPFCYREAVAVRQTKKDLGRRRASNLTRERPTSASPTDQLAFLAAKTQSPVMTTAIRSLIRALR